MTPSPAGLLACERALDRTLRGLVGHCGRSHPPAFAAGGRCIEARGPRESAYTGAYWIEGTMIYCRDDIGFSADGQFRDGVTPQGW